jgi:uncharacterized small protein (DUF1192 family)
VNEPYSTWTIEELGSEIVALVASIERLEDERDRLQAVVDAAISYVFALEGQKEAVVVRARRSYEAALTVLDDTEQPDGSPEVTDG